MTAFLNVNYDDGDSKTFKGLTISLDDKKIEFNTGNPLIDWYDYYKFIYQSDFFDKIQQEYNTSFFDVLGPDIITINLMEKGRQVA